MFAIIYSIWRYIVLFIQRSNRPKELLELLLYLFIYPPSLFWIQLRLSVLFFFFFFCIFVLLYVVTLSVFLLSRPYYLYLCLYLYLSSLSLPLYLSFFLTVLWSLYGGISWGLLQNSSFQFFGVFRNNFPTFSWFRDFATPQKLRRWGGGQKMKPRPPSFEIISFG